MKLVLFLLAASLSTAAPVHVDLVTVMKLAGANNDEIQLARVKHTETLAESKLAWQRFWPSLNLGVGYKRHDGNIQDVAGAIFDASKQQYTVGPSVLIDWAPGEIYYAALAAKQKALAAEQLAEKSRRDIVLQATGRYYDLLANEASVAIIEDDLRLTQDYEKQLAGAVTSGTAFRADLLRVKTQVSRAKLAIRQEQEKRDLAAAALADSELRVRMRRAQHAHRLVQREGVAVVAGVAEGAREKRQPAAQPRRRVLALAERRGAVRFQQLRRVAPALIAGADLGDRAR